jgi:hypothetical protein
MRCHHHPPTLRSDVHEEASVKTGARRLRDFPDIPSASSARAERQERVCGRSHSLPRRRDAARRTSGCDLGLATDLDLDDLLPAGPVRPGPGSRWKAAKYIATRSSICVSNSVAGTLYVHGRVRHRRLRAGRGPQRGLRGRGAVAVSGGEWTPRRTWSWWAEAGQAGSMSTPSRTADLDPATLGTRRDDFTAAPRCGCRYNRPGAPA